MDIELIAIGNELVLGFTVDTNGAEIGRALAEVGVRVVRRAAVGDDADAIRDAVRGALRRTGAVITTGGLGPTRDDITKEAVADLFGMPLVFREEIWTELLERYKPLGRVPSPSNRTQAEVPEGAVALRNRRGTAPGLWLERDGLGLVVMMPGVPIEMRMMLADEVAPRLAARARAAAGAAGEHVTRSRTVRTTAIPESTLAERMGEIETEIAPLTLAYLPGFEGVDMRLTAWNLPAADAEERLTRAAAVLRERAGVHAYGADDDDLAALVLEAARRRGVSLAVGESCTGGLVGGRLTAVPGSSDVFLGGLVAYANSAKTALLDVPEALIAEHGAVSGPVASAMAVGACRRLGADYAVAVTGVAGPGGGTPEKPVGTVWIAVAERGGAAEATRTVFWGTREEVRARAGQLALYRLRLRLEGRD